jgi:putative FmdB family regulatory protein
MPMYDFKCDECGRDFEELVPRDYREAPCPGCGSKETQRQLSIFSSRTASQASCPIPGGGPPGCKPSGGGGCAPGG